MIVKWDTRGRITAIMKETTKLGQTLKQNTCFPAGFPCKNKTPLVYFPAHLFLRRYRDYSSKLASYSTLMRWRVEYCQEIQSKSFASQATEGITFTVDERILAFFRADEDGVSTIDSVFGDGLLQNVQCKYPLQYTSITVCFFKFSCSVFYILLTLIRQILIQI